MPELHDLLERRASSYEPPPDLFDRVLDRRRRRYRNRRVGTVVVALAVAAAGIGGLVRAFSSGPTPAGDPRGPFLGTWVTADLDGSTPTMVIRAAGGGAVEILVHDDFASVCSGAPSTMTGTGRLEGDGELVIPSPALTCDDGSEPEALSGPPLEEQLRNLTFVHDPETDALTDTFGVVWNREGDREPTPEASPRWEAEQIIAEGTLTSFAATESGTVLTVWETCEDWDDTDCGHAWRLGKGSQTRATGMVGHGDVHVDANAASGGGFVLTPAGSGLGPAGQHNRGFLIAEDGTASRLSKDCRDATWSTPTEPRRLSWAPGLNFVDTVTGVICPTSRLGGRPLAQGVFTADGTLWALVDNETGPETLTIGRYDGARWDYHDFGAQGGSWTSALAAAGSNVVVLQAGPEPSPQQLVGLAVTTDGGVTWSEVLDRDVLERDLPFSTYADPDPQAWFSGYTSMAFAGTSVLYVADGRGDLWRSTDFTTFSQVEVSGGVSDLKPTGDALIARLDDGNDLVRISADGTVEAVRAR